ncbi:MAG: peptidoglycan-binding protein [Pseudomonadota bacterium]
MGVLKRGDKGSKVKQMQTLLQKSGAKPSIKPTGTFCPLTEQAVKDFQKKNKLKIDGIVGKATMGALEGAGEKPVKWTVKDVAKARKDLDHVIARETRAETHVDDWQRKLIGTKDKKINVLRQKYDVANKAFFEKAFEFRDALAEIAQAKREFDYAKSNEDRQRLLDLAKSRFSDSEKFNKAAEKLRLKAEAAHFALMMELGPMMDAA